MFSEYSITILGMKNTAVNKPHQIPDLREFTFHWNHLTFWERLCIGRSISQRNVKKKNTEKENKKRKRKGKKGNHTISAHVNPMIYFILF